MATGKLPKPYDGYEEYELSKDSGATNWTLTRSHLCVMGKTAYLQFVGSVTSSQDTSTLTVIKLPVKPPYEVEGRYTTSVYAVDFNYRITTAGYFQIQRTPQISNTSNIRINVVFPIA